MKWLAAIVLLLAVTWTASGQQVNDVIPRSPAHATISTNHVITPLVTNATPVTNIVVRVDAALYHTFQFYCLTNPFIVYVDKSLDGVTYVPHATNSIANGVAQEVSLTGKYLYLQVRTSGTNIANGKINYIGGR